MKKRKKKKHSYQTKIGYENLYKPVAAEHFSCLVIFVPVIIFIIFVVILLILKNKGVVQF